MSATKEQEEQEELAKRQMATDLADAVDEGAGGAGGGAPTKRQRKGEKMSGPTSASGGDPRLWGGRWKKSDIKSKGLATHSQDCERNKSDSIGIIISEIKKDKITDIITVGPGGYKPFHNGHLLSVKTAIAKAVALRDEAKLQGEEKKVCVVIVTSCAGRKLKEKPTKEDPPEDREWVIHRGTMFNVWRFVQAAIDKISDGVPVYTSWADGWVPFTSLKELVNNAETDVKRIHTLYSPGDDGNEGQFQKIFKDDFAKPWLKMFEQPREDIGGVSISGSAGRRYIIENKKTEFIEITNEIDETGEYFDELRRMYFSAKTGGRRTRRRQKTRRRHRRKTAKNVRKKKRTRRIRRTRRKKTKKSKRKII